MSITINLDPRTSVDTQSPDFASWCERTIRVREQTDRARARRRAVVLDRLRRDMAD